jgi:hypothetical protein
VVSELNQFNAEGRCSVSGVLDEWDLLYRSNAGANALGSNLDGHVKVFVKSRTEATFVR